MRFPSGPDEPAPPSAAGVRPFLRGATGGRPTPVRGEAPGEQTTSLRPFVITSGRVSGVDSEIGLETQVTTTATAVPARLPPEKRAIVTLCAEPHSVAEISARLKMHFGVIRVLVGDLWAAGQLDVHVLENDSPDPETIMRVIRGLRAIS